MIIEKSDSIIEVTKKDIVDLTLKVICDLVDLTEDRMDSDKLKNDLDILIEKHLKKIIK